MDDKLQPEIIWINPTAVSVVIPLPPTLRTHVVVGLVNIPTDSFRLSAFCRLSAFAPACEDDPSASWVDGWIIEHCDDSASEIIRWTNQHRSNFTRQPRTQKYAPVLARVVGGSSLVRWMYALITLDATSERAFSEVFPGAM